jgi:hypothetical protein
MPWMVREGSALAFVSEGATARAVNISKAD